MDDGGTTATESLMRLLPQVVAGAVSLSAIGYFIGWRETSAYYSALGAPWAASSISPIALLQLSSSTAGGIAMAWFLSLVLLQSGSVSLKRLPWVCAFFLLLGAVALSASQGLFGNVSTTASYSLASAGAVAYTVSAGVTLTELIGRMGEGGGRFKSAHLWLVYWFVLPGLFWAPDRLGHARAQRDLDTVHSSLPTVELAGARPAERWRSVHLADGRSLLVLLPTASGTAQFRVVEAKDILAIYSANTAKGRR